MAPPRPAAAGDATGRPGHRHHGTEPAAPDRREHDDHLRQHAAGPPGGYTFVPARRFSGLAERPRVVHADDVRPELARRAVVAELDRVAAAERLHPHQIRPFVTRAVD